MPEIPELYDHFWLIPGFRNAKVKMENLLRPRVAHPFQPLNPRTADIHHAEAEPAAYQFDVSRFIAKERTPEMCSKKIL